MSACIVNRPPDWTLLAVCAEVDPDLFFPDEYGPAADAIGICRNCEVRPQCLEFALEHPGESGVWGGFSERGRRDPVRQYRAGVPVQVIIAEDNEKFFRHAERSAESAAAAAELRKARRREGESRRQQQAQAAARASANARAARVRREITEAEAAGEQRCTGPCGLVKALGEFSQRKGRRRYRVCKRCRADAELLRLRQAADLASPNPQAREKTAA